MKSVPTSLILAAIPLLAGMGGPGSPAGAGFSDGMGLVEIKSRYTTIHRCDGIAVKSKELPDISRTAQSALRAALGCTMSSEEALVSTTLSAMVWTVGGRVTAVKYSTRPGVVECVDDALRSVGIPNAPDGGHQLQFEYRRLEVVYTETDLDQLEQTLPGEMTTSCVALRTKLD